MHDADAECVAWATKQAKTGLPQSHHLRARRLNACLIWTSSSVTYKANVQGAERPAGLKAASTINQQPPLALRTSISKMEKASSRVIFILY